MIFYTTFNIFIEVSCYDDNNINFPELASYTDKTTTEMILKWDDQIYYLSCSDQ